MHHNSTENIRGEAPIGLYYYDSIGLLIALMSRTLVTRVVIILIIHLILCQMIVVYNEIILVPLVERSPDQFVSDFFSRDTCSGKYISHCHNPVGFAVVEF